MNDQKKKTEYHDEGIIRMLKDIVATKEAQEEWEAERKQRRAVNIYEIYGVIFSMFITGIIIVLIYLAYGLR